MLPQHYIQHYIPQTQLIIHSPPSGSNNAPHRPEVTMHTPRRRNNAPLQSTNPSLAKVTMHPSHLCFSIFHVLLYLLYYYAMELIGCHMEKIKIT